MVHAAHARRVLGGPVAAVLVARVVAPAVVDHHVVFHRRFVEQPGEQFRDCAIRRGQLPLAIAEDDVGLVARHHVLELRDHVLADVARLVGQPERVVPLVERIVIAHVQTLAAHGVGEIAEQIAVRADLDGVPRASPSGARLLCWATAQSPRDAWKSAQHISRRSAAKHRPSGRDRTTARGTAARNSDRESRRHTCFW